MPILEDLMRLSPPVFDIHESMSHDLTKLKVGQKPQLIINYKVLEKTKSFVTLRITSVLLKPTNIR